LVILLVVGFIVYKKIKKKMIENNFYNLENEFSGNHPNPIHFKI
jgi:hypothetical protein